MSKITTIVNNIIDKVNNCVKLDGDQIIAGIKTFSSFSITPPSDPTTNYQVANKKYVDDKTVASSETVAGVIELATTAETQAGTDDLRAITPLKLKNSVIGLGQTWQDVTGSRVLGTTYTNSTGKPIFISIIADNYGVLSTSASITVGGIQVAFIDTYSSADGGTISTIVPNSATYNVASTHSNTKWLELR